jgi:hypothetical protein
MSDEAKDQKMVDQATEKLGEYFDHVIILCCKEEGDGEFMYVGENGSHRARYSMAKELVMHEEDNMRYGDELSNEDDDD